MHKVFRGIFAVFLLIAACTEQDIREAVMTPQQAPPPVSPQQEPSAVKTTDSYGRSWRPLLSDNLHDPEGPGITVLQQPREALGVLPPDPNVGNQVRWVKALEEGHITPRTNIYPETKIEVLDLDIIMPDTASAPMVRFPHKQHTEWLDCKNCHDKWFKKEAGATSGLNMFAILQGEFCGRCHGAVAFPLSECFRCHNVKRENFTGKPGAQWPGGKRPPGI